MSDLSLIPGATWREARCRAEVIRPLANRDGRPRYLVRAAAMTLGLSKRQTYTLLRRGREAGGALTALLPGRSSGGRNQPRTAPGRPEPLLDAAQAERGGGGARGGWTLPCREAAAAVLQHRPTPVAGAAAWRAPQAGRRPPRGQAGAWPCSRNSVPVGLGADRPNAHGPGSGGSGRPRTNRTAVAHGRHRRAQPLHRGFPHDVGSAVGHVTPDGKIRPGGESC